MIRKPGGNSSGLNSYPRAHHNQMVEGKPFNKRAYVVSYQETLQVDFDSLFYNSS